MITRKDFERGEFKKRIYGSIRENHPVAKFLKRYSKNAFDAKEIAKKVKMSQGAVRGMLAKLGKEGLVVHKAPYFAWKKKQGDFIFIFFIF